MKYYTIKENHLFGKAYSKGKKAVGKHCVIYILPDYRAKALAKANPLKQKFNRYGITVSRHIGGAVQRNRCKRIIREAYRGCEKARTFKKGFLIVFVARDSTVNSGSAELTREMIYLFEKLSMFENENNKQGL